MRDLRGADAAADELATIVAEADTAYARGLSAEAQGRLLLARGEARAALLALRSAWIAWQDIDAPYEAARVRVLMGRSYRELADEEAAALEFRAAERVLRRLAAAPDLAEVTRLLRPAAKHASGKLTPREVQVITLLAAGRTNRAIGRELGISERTVDRHVSNILTKLDLSSRSAATAYAYEHGVLP